jgi:predicted nucleotide-binding protein (sugar kinase/HSP70/actin superfamily)
MKKAASAPTEDIEHLVSTERDRLMREAGLVSDLSHYRRLEERPFTAKERSRTTVLFGNLTPKHEEFIKAVFQGAGYRFQNLPQPDKTAFQIGKEYCNNGLCNPNYFTAGGLIQYLENLESDGLSREEIVDNYLYFFPGDCGPCRFGMYESEYRQALVNAGFLGFRVVTFKTSTVIKEGASQPGLQFNCDMGMGLLNALILGDLFYDATYQIRPYEIIPGDTDQAIQECLTILTRFLRGRRHYEVLERTPGWLSKRLAPRTKLKNTLNNLGKFRQHFWGEDYREVLAQCADRLDQVEVDRTRCVPIIKVVGEFYSHLAESYANYNMFAFLENEGVQVCVDSIAGHLLYWLYKVKLNQLRREGLDVPHPNASSWQVRKRLANLLANQKKPLLFAFADRMYTRLYRRINERLGNLAHSLIDQKALAEEAEPFYHPLTRGGEGHLEVAKSIYYTKQNLCHMILSLKPFGCMPSTQSDGVMASVLSKHEDILFVSVETSGDGDINAISRVQMALADAKRRAQKEFDDALESTGRSLDKIREFAASRTELRRPSLKFEHRLGVTGVAANFVLHVAKMMDQAGIRNN